MEKNKESIDIEKNDMEDVEKSEKPDEKKRKKTGDVKKEKKQEDKNSEQVQKLQSKLDQTNDSLLRLAAEYDNYRKRTAKEKEEINSMSKVSILSELLPVVDNLERALANTTDNLADYKKGVEMIANQLLESFKKLGAESFGEAGDEFDPNLYNAVMHIDDENLGENVVAQVFSKGYKIGDKVIRCAMVSVAN